MLFEPQPLGDLRWRLTVGRVSDQRDAQRKQLPHNPSSCGRRGVPTNADQRKRTSFAKALPVEGCQSRRPLVSPKPKLEGRQL